MFSHTYAATVSSACVYLATALAGKVMRSDVTVPFGLNQLIFELDFLHVYSWVGWLGSRVVSVLDSGAEGPGFKSQPRRCRLTVLGKLFTPTVPLFTKQQNR